MLKAIVPFHIPRLGLLAGSYLADWIRSDESPHRVWETLQSVPLVSQAELWLYGVDA